MKRYETKYDLCEGRLKMGDLGDFWVGSEQVLCRMSRFESQSTELSRGPPELVQHFRL
jgi:hypothetical protein